MNGTKNRRYGLDQRHVLYQGLRFEVGEPRAQKGLSNVPQIKEHLRNNKILSCSLLPF